MQDTQAQAVVAGHLCLDMIPKIGWRPGGVRAFMTPGSLLEVGPLTLATGGAVANTGIALHRLGLPTRLMGKVGDDPFGQVILNAIGRYGAELAGGMIVAPGEMSSYTVVFNPPDVDRVFLHCSGCNDTFSAADIAADQLAGARLFHFGYPPLMRRLYEDGGDNLEQIFRRAKGLGLTTSLDMARPDPDSPAGQVDWTRILARALPHVDIFLPSIEELLFMLDSARFDAMQQAGGEAEGFPGLDGTVLAALADRLIGMGAAVVVIKLGALGLYLRTTADAARLAAMGACAPDELAPWQGRELFSDCFQVNVVGTTGAGDCTIAGFLAGVLKGMAPEAALTLAVGVGAFNVEVADATSGIPDLATAQRRIAAGWPRRPHQMAWSGWRWESGRELWLGPNDGR